jgi:glycosyltransferase involved in cell wall biosynthesis
VLLPSTLFQLARFLRENRIDVVSVHYPLPWAAYFGVLRRVSRWRLVVTYHGNDAHDLPEWQPSERLLIKLLLRSADRVTAVSSKLLQKVSGVLRLPGLPAVAVSNGAPLDVIDEINVPARVRVPPRYIVTVGHLIKRKGIDILLSALTRLRDRGEVIPLVIVGDGSERASLEELARRGGLGAEVHFVGDQRHDQALALMKGSAFFVLASRAEGLPLVIVEAMACRKAVVATAVDGVPELVTENGTGLLVPPEDPEALAAAIGRLYADGELRERLATTAYQRAVAEFSWKAIADRYLDVYSQALRNA